MKLRLLVLGIAVLTALFFVTGYASNDEARSDDKYEHNEHDEYDDDDDDDRFLNRWFKKDRSQARAYMQDAGFTQYKTECGDCHMAYPPGLLNAESWRAVMNSLDDHFGDNAELDNETVTALTDYLLRHSVERRNNPYNVSKRALDRNGESPLRIIDTNYFRAQHHDLSPRVVTDNPELKSISQCDACHRKADQGSFDEDDVVIPGYGRWDD